MKLRLTLPLALMVMASMHCKRSNQDNVSHPATQGALSTAVTRSDSPSVESSRDEQEAARWSARAEQAPALRMERGQLTVQSDDAHLDAHAHSTNHGFAVTWGDHDHRRAYLMLADQAGTPMGAPALVRHSQSEESDVYPPDVAAVSGGYVAAWSDPANNRVRFLRLDASRRPVGRSKIVHDGLESPRTTRLAVHPSGFAIAVQMDRGVYFARLSPDGTRIGEGVVLVDDTEVSSIHDLQATAQGFSVQWQETDGARRVARISTGGRVESVRTLSDSSRLAMR
ncbi:MAG: hypothetical protein Q8Q09_09400 [Deltaproteobacteria bacterium]|nr:hypothetical protein [Deltaproteobacteria bacterium]